MNNNLNSTYNINISSEAILKVFFWLIFFVLGYFLRDLLLVMLVSIVIASAVEPFVHWLIKRHIPRTISVILIYIVFFITILVLFSIFLPLVFEDFISLFTEIPYYIKNINISGDTSYISDKILMNAKNFFAESFSVESVMPGLTNLLSGASGGIIDSAKIIFNEAFMIILVAVFSFYFAVQEDGIDNFIRLVFPIKHEEYIINLWTRSKKKIGLWMQGQILLGVLIGVFVFLGLSIIGVKNALALAVFAAFIEIIPGVGPMIASVPAIVLTYVQNPSLLPFVFGLYVIIAQFENHFIYPLVIRKIIGIPPVISILFLIIGWRVAGFWGILISIPMAVLILEIAFDFEKKKRFASVPAENNHK